MLLTRYGLSTWLPIFAALAALAALSVWQQWWWALPLLGLVWIAVAWFFRDPIRRLPDAPCGTALSPADGTVSAICRVDQHEATDGPALIIRLFLSVLNVHVNRAPLDGEIVAIRYTPGRFFDARTEESAALNESNLLTLRLPNGPTFGVRQVSGKIARRIVCPLQVGDRVTRGEKFGMIRFGSTTELILPDPDRVEVLVKVGDKVRGGLTALARMAVPAASQPIASAITGRDEPAGRSVARHAKDIQHEAKADRPVP